jgi:hypothetical protein
MVRLLYASGENDVAQEMLQRMILTSVQHLCGSHPAASLCRLTR